jgi:3-hydroxyacyl-[acyl-carrier-protein] dehydratase
MFKDKFFSIVNYSQSGDNAEFLVRLHKDHEIYQAHFPNNPITPGVCIIQVIKELFSQVKQEKYGVKNIKSVKFTYPIDPILYPEVNYKLDIEDAGEEKQYRVKATVYKEDVVFAKINMLLAPQ